MAHPLADNMATYLEQLEYKLSQIHVTILKIEKKVNHWNHPSNGDFHRLEQQIENMAFQLHITKQIAQHKGE